ncbi:hypothetical protein DPMN_180841 [Dreissena polymorpha]|uniref:Uncharacterized protein n=1 Tax=Dreissena polymorpha TaxID=45954 RepID=A0A9D4DCD9_DREPO|nr:hypothetical protein DPMN_180841 [Dreissena polymorpha]
MKRMTSRRHDDRFSVLLPFPALTTITPASLTDYSAGEDLGVKWVSRTHTGLSRPGPLLARTSLTLAGNNSLKTSEKSERKKKMPIKRIEQIFATLRQTI